MSVVLSQFRGSITARSRVQCTGWWLKSRWSRSVSGSVNVTRVQRLANLRMSGLDRYSILDSTDRSGPTGPFDRRYAIRKSIVWVIYSPTHELDLASIKSAIGQVRHHGCEHPAEQRLFQCPDTKNINPTLKNFDKNTDPVHGSVPQIETRWTGQAG